MTIHGAILRAKRDSIFQFWGKDSTEIDSRVIFAVKENKEIWGNERIVLENERRFWRDNCFFPKNQDYENSAAIVQENTFFG